MDTLYGFLLGLGIWLAIWGGAAIFGKRATFSDICDVIFWIGALCLMTVVGWFKPKKRL